MNEALIRELHARLRSALEKRFEIGELLGAGGFAAVFRARDPVLGRDVAIKVLDVSLAADATATERLLDEARLVATIEHPHIAPLFEAGRHGDIVCLVMRYYPEGSLGDRLAGDGTIPAAEIARLGAEIADALAAAHERGVVHLDIKPDNILLDADGHAAVVDFGIATAAGRPGEDGVARGTPHYMSPEQVAGDPVDGRADVYALGVVLYELATGKRPIGGDSAAAVMANQIRQAPAPLSSLAPELPTALAGVITRALAKEPEARWSSARELGDALRRAGSEHLLVPPRMARRRTRRRWYRRGGILLGGVIAGIALLVYAAVSVIRVFSEGEPPSLDVMAPLIPAEILDSARTRGVIDQRDTVIYVFAPNGHGLDDAMLVTTRHLIAISQGAPRRYAHAADYDLDIRRTGSVGMLILRDSAASRVDTLYHGMSGREQQALFFALRRALP